MCRDPEIHNICTWRAFQTILDFNFIEDGSLGLTSLGYNLQQAKVAAQKAQQAQAAEKDKTAGP